MACVNRLGHAQGLPETVAGQALSTPDGAQCKGR